MVTSRVPKRIKYLALRQPFSIKLRLVEDSQNTLEDSLQLTALISSCQKGNREAQKMLYEQFYGYAMSVCLRYSPSREEAREILNDGFMKVFTRLNQRDQQASFKSWLRKIMIHNAIDYYRKNNKHYHHQDIDDVKTQGNTVENQALSSIAYGDLIQMVQQLPPAYRTVFNLHVIDGYTHEEIATQLNITEGTSKSNLFKAREHLKDQLQKLNIKSYAQYF